MPQYCCVPGCINSGGHRFPRDNALLLKWRVAIRRTDHAKQLWKPGPLDVVCRQHFKPADYHNTLLGERCRLTPDAVPSVFSFNVPQPDTPRSQRKKQRDRQIEVDVVDGMNLDIQQEVVIPVDEAEAFVDLRESDSKLPCSGASLDSTVQCELPYAGQYTIDMFFNDPAAVQYYTAFENYDHFIMFYQCLGDSVHDLNYKCCMLEPVNQLFMTLMKLRQAKDDVELSMFFKISQSTVSRVICTWINFLYFQLKELDIWPSKEIIEETMPSDFSKKFPSTRVILDATEIPIQKPSNVISQCATWSSYKHRNTLKAMIGCTPRGAISYISDTYGGSTSDRQIMERSELLQKDQNKFVKGDSIMADRGIMVQDLFACQDVFVNTPTMLKGKSQLDPNEVVHDRRVASKRIHIERVIGLSKTYKILKREMPSTKTILGGRIVFICFMLSNFRKGIVDEFA